MRHRIARAALVGLVAVIWAAASPMSVRADDCGNEPVACGSPIVHTCYCGDTLRWSYTLSGTLTNRGSGTSPCTTSVGLYMTNGQTLTGDGTASIAGPGTSNSVGIKFDGTTGATVTSSSSYLKVSGFERGVQLINNASGNIVENVESYSNNNHQTNPAGSYGIDLRVGATNNTVRSVYVHDNADEGIHLGGGSYANTVQDGLFQCNTDQQIYLVDTYDNQILNNTAVSGNGTSVCAGNAQNMGSMKVHHSNTNTFKGNTFQNKLVNITAGSNGNTFGGTGTGEGNTITGARLEFQQGESPDSSGNWYPAYNNTVLNVSMSGGTNGCVNFKKHADSPSTAVLPYGNKVRGSALNCTGNTHEIIALSDNGTGTSGGQNYVCNSTCNGPTCTESDATDQLNIITVQSADCP